MLLTGDILVEEMHNITFLLIIDSALPQAYNVFVITAPCER